MSRAADDREGRARIGRGAVDRARVLLRIQDLNQHGQGVGRLDGQVVFVDGALPGEAVEAVMGERSERRRDYAVATLARVVEPSPDRVAPPCPVFEACGGCQLQHLSYEAQLAAKRAQVETALRRIGHLTGVQVDPCQPSPAPWGYRHKGVFPIGSDGRGGLVMGPYAARSHDIVDAEACLVQHPVINEIMAAARRVFAEHHLSAYDERSGRGLLRHLMVRVRWAPPSTLVEPDAKECDRREAHAMAVIVTSGAPFPERRRVARQLVEAVSELRTVVHNIQDSPTNVILGQREDVLWGDGFIEDVLDGLVFRISPRSFFQVNPEQARELYRRAVLAAESSPGQLAVDAYCGTGTVAMFLARQTDRVIGIESVPEAVADARQNALRNGLTERVEFVRGTVEETLPRLLEQGLRPEVIVLDPPRRGAEPAVLEAIARARARRVVYVSCSPATLARDLGRLAGSGYRVERVTPFDMFPHTVHVECLAVATRGDRGG